MFSSPIIDIALVLSFTYFILSLLVSTIHEYLSSLNNKRGKYLETAITNLFFDQDWKKLAGKIYSDSNIIALQSDPKSLPSYIPATSFALALMDQFKNGQSIVLDINMIRNVLTDDVQAKATGVEGAVRKVLLNFYERAQGDLQNFQKQVESFYNSAMDRASGVYKRSAQYLILAISFVVAGLLNADTVNIVKTLWANPDSLKQTADNVQSAVKQLKGFNVKLDSIGFDGKNVVVTKNVRDTTKKSPASSTSVINQIKTTQVFLTSSGIPLGWSKGNFPNGASGDGILDWLIKIGGILLTAAALMLGAPFWFDLINKIVSLRATGQKPADASTGNATGNTNAGNTVTTNPVG